MFFSHHLTWFVQDAGPLNWLLLRRISVTTANWRGQFSVSNSSSCPIMQLMDADKCYSYCMVEFWHLKMAVHCPQKSHHRLSWMFRASTMHYRWPSLSEDCVALFAVMMISHVQYETIHYIFSMWVASFLHLWKYLARKWIYCSWNLL